MGGLRTPRACPFPCFFSVQIPSLVHNSQSCLTHSFICAPVPSIQHLVLTKHCCLWRPSVVFNKLHLLNKHTVTPGMSVCVRVMSACSYSRWRPLTRQRSVLNKCGCSPYKRQSWSTWDVEFIPSWTAVYRRRIILTAVPPKAVLLLESTSP